MSGASERPRVELTGLRCAGRHGAYAGERHATRTFLVDLSLQGDVDADAAERAAAAARHAVSSHSRALLERVADDVARSVLEAVRTVELVRVRVVKPDPPGLDAASEAVTLTLARART